MRKFVVLAMGLMTLAACQTTGINPHAGNSFQGYKSKTHYRAYAIAQDPRGTYSSGRAWGYSTVKDAMKNALEMCKKSLGKYPGSFARCKVMYIGDTNIGDMSEPEIAVAISAYQEKHIKPTYYSVQADIDICGHALQSTREEWEELAIYAPYVKEAKRRKLSPQNCSQLLAKPNT